MRHRTARVTLDGAPRTRCSAGALRYDKAGDQHYDYISAWIKATRGSDPDASLYYLAVMLEGGEDPRFIARRMVILASEDIGNADPRALEVAVAAAQAVEHVGLPEGQFALAQAAIYLSLAPKSDAAKQALGAARAHVREHGAQPPPAYLQCAGYTPRRGSGRGDGYDYPHDRPGHLSAQELAPEGVAGERFYEPDDAEAALRERLEEIRRARGVDDRPRPPCSPGRMPRTDTASPPWGDRAAAAESFSPATGGASGAVAVARPRDGRRAAVDGAAASVQPLWAMLRLADRARYMVRAAQAVIDESDELTDLVVAEQGRPRAEVEVMELLPAVETLQWLAEHGPRHPGRRADPLLAHAAPGQARALELRAARRRRRARPGARAVRHAAGRRRRGADGRQRRRPQALAARAAVRRADRARLRPRRAARGPAAGRPRPRRRRRRARRRAAWRRSASPARRARAARSARRARAALKRSVLDARRQGRDARARRRQRAARGPRRDVGGVRQRGAVRRIVERALCVREVHDRFLAGVVRRRAAPARRRPGRSGDVDRPARRPRARRARARAGRRGRRRRRDAALRRRAARAPTTRRRCSAASRRRCAWPARRCPARCSWSRRSLRRRRRSRAPTR